MTNEPGPQKRTIDERLDALAMNMELLEKRVDETTENVNKLATVVDKHEQDRQRFFRAMRAALEAWFGEENHDDH